MEYYNMYVAILAIILTIIFLLKLAPKSNKYKLPPGPKPWPIIGNIHLLDNEPHSTLAKLAKIYGPIMSLKLGFTTTLVISSPEVGKEMFLKHDLVFSSRKVSHAAMVREHAKDSLTWLPVGPRWRNLRKIAAMQLFGSKQLDAGQALRQKKVNDLVEYARGCCEKGQAVDIGNAGFTTSLNLICNTFFSMDMASHDSSISREFRDLVWCMLKELGKPNLSDFFPFMKRLDVQGVMKRIQPYFDKKMSDIEKIIEQRLRDQVTTRNDGLTTLMQLTKENKMSLDEVKHMLMDMFVAGTDPTTSTFEWGMTELLRNPEKMAKAQHEIDQLYSKGEQIQESDISKLPYLRAIVKETLRLHPPAPLMLPHMTNEDVQLCNYFVPKDTQVWVNVWAIGHDPSLWPNAHSFSPERFLENEVDIKGHDFELIPFGSGRRMCPGLSLGYRMVHLMLASLLHSFNWKPTHGLSHHDIDVEEEFGLTLKKARPFQAIPLAR